MTSLVHICVFIFSEITVARQGHAVYASLLDLDLPHVRCTCVIQDRDAVYSSLLDLDLPYVVYHDSVKHLQQQWVDGKMTNFEYLCHLNTMAGRSFNDLMQYPVFPFVLRQYTGDTLDLLRADSYRSVHRRHARPAPGRLVQVSTAATRSTCSGQTRTGQYTGDTLDLLRADSYRSVHWRHTGPAQGRLVQVSNACAYVLVQGGRICSYVLVQDGPLYYFVYDGVHECTKSFMAAMLNDRHLGIFM